MTRCFAFAIALFLSFEAAAASAADRRLSEMTLEELMEIRVETVSSASRSLQKVTEAPASITIITADEIRRYGYRTLADVLRSIRGFYLTYDRNYHYLGARGISRPGDYNSRFLLMVNGHRLNDAIYDQAPVGTDFPLDVDLIDRVEVVRGPGSSLYGTSAVLAVIDVITRNGEDLQPAEVSAEYGAFDTYRGRATAGYGRGGRSILLSGSLAASSGDRSLYYPVFDDPPTDDGVARGLDDDRYGTLFAIGSAGGFTLQGGYARRRKDVPTAAYEMVFNDPRASSVDERGFLSLRYRHLFADGLELTAGTGYDHYYYGGAYPLGSLGDAVLNRDTANAETWTLEAQGVRPLGSRQKITLGGELRLNLRQDQANFDVRPRAGYLDVKRSTSVWGIYLQDEIRLLSNLTLYAGLRHDRYTTFGGATSPRISLVYAPAAGSVLKFLYGRAFRAPTVYEVFYDDEYLYLRNPHLKPERIDAAEIVYEQYVGDHLRTSVSAFHYSMERFITQMSIQGDEGEVLQFRNNGAATASGGEAEVEARLRGTHARASYSYTWAEEEGGGEMADAPRHLAKLNVTVPVQEELLRIGTEIQYTGSRRTLAGEKTGGYATVNTTLHSVGFLGGLEMSFTVYNLLNTSFSHPASADHLQDSIRQDGRSYRIKAVYRF